MYEIAVLDYRLLPETQAIIQALAANEVVFPTKRCLENERISETGNASIALITPWEKIDTTYLDACPQLKYIGSCGTSTANIDLDELERRGIAFSNIISGDKESVAEFFFMQLVSLVRGLGDYQWKLGEQHELVGRRIGIIGLGAVGKAMAHMALAYKMDVVYYSPHRKRDWENKGVLYLNKEALLASSQVIILCSPTNVVVVDEFDFNKINPGSILIQACGGSPFDKPAFYKWISKDGNFALFDMSANEINYQSYKDLPRVIFSRLTAGDTYESNERRGKRVVENLQSFINHR